jgi:hypothetical protein
MTKPEALWLMATSCLRQEVVPCRELCDRAPDAGRLQVHGVPRVLTSGEDPKRAFEGLQDAWRAAACDSHHASTSVLRMERNSAHSDIKGGSQRDETYGSAVGVELQESNREQVANDRDSLLRVASFLEVIPNAPRSQLRATKCTVLRAGPPHQCQSASGQHAKHGKIVKPFCTFE